LDPQLEELIEEGGGEEEVEVILKLRPDDEVPAHVRIVARFGDIATCRLRRDRIRPTWEHPAVVSAKAPRYVTTEPEPVESAALGEADVSVHDRRRPDDVGVTGRGVVVGLLDWGCDFAHTNFRKADGSTRLLALWDQGNRRGDSPGPYGYGVVYSQPQIDRALRNPKPYEALGYHPARSDPFGSGSHGTHVCDIAAGNGSAGGSVLGIAPEADIVFVNLAARGLGDLSNLGDSVRVLEALDFVARVAGRKPWVINLSLGQCGGPHTGLTLVEQAMDALLLQSPNRAIVQSTGNYFQDRTHAAGQLRPGQRHTLTWRTDKADRTPNELEIWYPGRDTLTVEVRPPGGEVVFRVALGEQRVLHMEGREVGRIYHRARDPGRGDNHVDLFLDPPAPAGGWRITLIGDDIVDGRFHSWVERDSASPGCQSRFDPQDAVSASTTGTICNGFRTIAVGAYNPHSPERELAPFSSSGPAIDGRSKPDLLAPGVGILAARSTPWNAWGASGALVRKSGTSMAAPHVTGCIALMLQAAPRPLWISNIRRLLLSSAEPVPATGDAPFRVGSGRLDIPAAVDAARRFGKKTRSHEPRRLEAIMASLAPFDNDPERNPLRPHPSEPADLGAGAVVEFEPGESEAYAPADAVWESGESAGARLVDATDAAVSAGRASGTTGGLLHVLMADLPELASFPGGSQLSPHALFRALTPGAEDALAQRLSEIFEVVAAPRSALEAELLPGDLLIRISLGEPDAGHLAILVTGQLRTLEQLPGQRATAEARGPGWYAEIIEGGASPHRRQDGFARQVLDRDRRMPANQMVVRIRPVHAQTAGEFTEDVRFQSPSAPFPSLSRECLTKLKGKRVAVIGAGLAGLMAARRLGQHGIDVIVHEARWQVGGRVLSTTTFSKGRIIEEGAELIGSFHTEWLKLAKHYGLAVVSRMDGGLYERAGLDIKLTLDKPLSMREINDLNKEMEARVLLPMAKDAEAIKHESEPWREPVLKPFDNMSVADALKNKYKVKPSERLWKMLEYLLVHNEVAPLEQMNFLGLLCKVKGGQTGPDSAYDDKHDRRMGYWTKLEIFRCADGCQKLATEMAKEIQKEYKAKLLLNRAVTHITLDKLGGLRVWSKQVIDRKGTLSPDPPLFVACEYVILAIPPNEKVWDDVKITVEGEEVVLKKAIGLLGTDPAVKFFTDVKERFWIKEKAAPYGGAVTLGQVWEGTDNQTRVGDQGVVLSVFAGPSLPAPLTPGGSGRRTPLPEEFKKDLRLLYPGYNRNFNKELFSNWHAVPFIRTGYASPRLGQIFNIGRKLNEPFRPLRGRLFFAGEHTDMAFFGYMEGALRSGDLAAKRVMEHWCGVLKEPAPKPPAPKPAPKKPEPEEPVFVTSAEPSRQPTAFEAESPFPERRLETFAHAEAGGQLVLDEPWGEDDPAPTVTPGRDADEIIVTRADGTRYHVRRKVRAQVLTRPGRPRAGFCSDDERVFFRVSWCEGTQGTIDAGVDVPGALKDLLNTVVGQINQGASPDQIKQTFENASVQPFVEFDITKVNRWKITGDLKLDVNRTGIISTAARVSADRGWIKLGVEYKDDGSGKQVLATVDVPLGRRTVHGKKCQVQELAVWWDAECLREVPTTDTTSSPGFIEKKETLYLYFEHARAILRRDPKATTESADVVNEILKSNPKLGTALLNKRSIQRLDYLVGQGYWLESVDGYASPEGSEAPGQPARGSADWVGNIELSRRRAKKVRDLIDARYVRPILQVTSLRMRGMRFPAGKSMPAGVGLSELPKLVKAPGVEIEGVELDRVIIHGGVEIECSELDRVNIHGDKKAADKRPFLEQCPKELARMTEDDRKYVTDARMSDRNRAERLFQNLRRVEIHLRQREKLRGADVPGFYFVHEHDCPPDVIEAAERKWGSRIPFTKPDPPVCG
jgi:monoamine oxidase/subtilisin family serine protease